MVLKIILALVVLSIGIFTAFRFGLFGSQESTPPIRELAVPIPTQTGIPIETTRTPTENSSTTSAKIKILTVPKYAVIKQPFTISWFIESSHAASVSHTAIHYGRVPQPDAKLPSDYPEKSTILKGTAPASFSAQLEIPTIGTYYLRAYAIVDNLDIWSDERTLSIRDR